MMGNTSQGRLGRLPNNAYDIDIPIGSILWFPTVVLRETVVVREYASPIAEGSRCLTRGEMQERHACCLSSGENPLSLIRKLHPIFPFLPWARVSYFPDTISQICPDNLMM
jgi:hypothetical protein